MHVQYYTMPVTLLQECTLPVHVAGPPELGNVFELQASVAVVPKCLEERLEARMRYSVQCVAYRLSSIARARAKSSMAMRQNTCSKSSVAF